MAFTIEPTHYYEDRATQYIVKQDGQPVLECSTGGTGPCWNIGDAPKYEGEDTGDPIHVCDLDDMIAALTALRDSEAHRQNVERWQ